MDYRTLMRMLALPEGRRTDAFLRYLLEPRFMGYWTFARPKSQGIELADALVWFDDTVFLFEAKTREGGAATEAWIKRNLGEAIEQINTRAGMLKRGEVTSLTNPWRGEVAWHPETVKYYYGVVVLNHLSEPYDPHEVATESFRGSQIPIQVFSLLDLSELLRFISTVTDFIVYYELRYAHLQKWKVKVHEEASTYGTIIADMAELTRVVMGAGRNVQGMKSFQQAVTRVMVRPPEGRPRDYAKVAASYLLDIAMGGVAKKFADIQDPGGVKSTAWEEVEMIGAVAEMSRLRRSVWGTRWLAVADEAIRGKAGIARYGHSPKRRRAYVIAASDKLEKDRVAWLMPEARARMVRLGCESCVILVGNPFKVRATFETVKQWLRGRQEKMPSDKILDATIMWIGRASPRSASRAP